MGDIIELKFISIALELVGKESHPTFHFIKLQRLDMAAFNNVKATYTKNAPLVSIPEEIWGFESVLPRWTNSSTGLKYSRIN